MLSKFIREEPTSLMLSTKLCLMSMTHSDTFFSGTILFKNQPTCRIHFQTSERPASLKIYLECIYLNRFGLRATRVSVNQPEANFVGFMESVESDSSVQQFSLSIPLNRLASELRDVCIIFGVHVIGESSFCLQLTDSQWKKQIIESINGPFTDLVLKVRGQKLLAHKSVLTARCPALTAKLKDAAVKQLILDEDPVTFRRFLHFLYTGILDDCDYCLKDMKTYAKKYCIDEMLPKFTANGTLEEMIKKCEADVNPQLTNGGVVMQYSWTLKKLPTLNRTTFSNKSKDGMWFCVAIQCVRFIPYTNCSEFDLYFFTGRNSRVVGVSYFNRWDPYSQKKHNMDLKKNLVFKSNFSVASGYKCYQFTFCVTIEQADNEEYRYELQDSLCPTQLWHSALDGMTTDVQLLVSGRIFHAHRWILAARSPVFAAMFSHDMLEANTGCVDITDITTSIFEQILFFIYNGRILDSTPNLLLLEAADKYQIETLVSIYRASSSPMEKDS